MLLPISDLLGSSLVIPLLQLSFFLGSGCCRVEVGAPTTAGPREPMGNVAANSIGSCCQALTYAQQNHVTRLKLIRNRLVYRFFCILGRLEEGGNIFMNCYSWGFSNFRV